MASTTVRKTLPATCVFGTLLFAAGKAQEPAPASAAAAPVTAAGQQALERDDPLLAWQAFRTAHRLAPEAPDALVGLGRAHLLLGRAATALAYAEVVLQQQDARQDAMALSVRAQIRARRFDDAVAAAERFVQQKSRPGKELLAAQASALFRVQRIDDAAAMYRRVLQLDPEDAEAHLRLGSGLMEPTQVVVTDAVRMAVAELRDGRLDAAIARLSLALAQQGADPVLHRLLGEALFQRRAAASMASQDEAFRRLQGLLPRLDASHLPIGDLMAAYPLLAAERRVIVDRAVLTFGSRLGRLLALGARHDLLLEVERTTDAASRESLRGRRTFDGRVWDDVRGIGGLHAATGIEALDEAASFGFDTLAHELAHQVHYYAVSPVDRARIRQLYVRAKSEGRWLDYYAATNEAEYFAQGVEAFVSLAKRPGSETTHGHTRFELLRIDPGLHNFIAGLVDHDPLRQPGVRQQLLLAAAEVALRCGRPLDALVAAELLDDGPERLELRQRARESASAASTF